MRYWGHFKVRVMKPKSLGERLSTFLRVLLTTVIRFAKDNFWEILL